MYVSPVIKVTVLVAIALKCFVQADEDTSDLEAVSSLSSSSSSSSSSKEDPLQSILPRVKFICKGRPEGYYADIDFDCEVFHYCKTNGFRFTFVCPPNSKFNQRQMTCDYEAKDNACTTDSVSGKKSKSTYKQSSSLPSDTSNDEQQQQLTSSVTLSTSIAPQSNLMPTSLPQSFTVNTGKTIEEDDEIDNTSGRKHSSFSASEAIHYNGNSQHQLLASGTVNSAHSTRKQQWPYLIGTTTAPVEAAATTTTTATSSTVNLPTETTTHVTPVVSTVVPVSTMHDISSHLMKQVLSSPPSPTQQIFSESIVHDNISDIFTHITHTDKEMSENFVNEIESIKQPTTTSHSGYYQSNLRADNNHVKENVKLRIFNNNIHHGINNNEQLLQPVYRAHNTDDVTTITVPTYTGDDIFSPSLVSSSTVTHDKTLDEAAAASFSSTTAAAVASAPPAHPVYHGPGTSSPGYNKSLSPGETVTMTSLTPKSTSQSATAPIINHSEVTTVKTIDTSNGLWPSSIFESHHIPSTQHVSTDQSAINFNSILTNSPGNDNLSPSTLSDTFSTFQSQFVPMSSLHSNKMRQQQQQKQQQQQQQQQQHKYMTPTSHPTFSTGKSQALKFSKLISSSGNHVKSFSDTSNKVTPITSINNADHIEIPAHHLQPSHLVTNKLVKNQEQHLTPASALFIFTQADSLANSPATGTSSNSLLSSSPLPPPSPSHLNGAPSHQSQLPNSLLSEFYSLPPYLQNQITSQLGLNVPAKQSQVNFHLLSGSTSPISSLIAPDDSSAAAATAGFNNNESIDPSIKPFNAEGAFGLPKIKPTKHKPFIPMDEQPPTNNFHTQLPNLLPSNHLLSLPSSLFPSNNNQMKKQQNIKSTLHSGKQQQQQQQSPQVFKVTNGQSSNQPGNSLIGEFNNLMRHNFFTRSRSPSQQNTARLPGINSFNVPAASQNLFNSQNINLANTHHLLSPPPSSIPNGMLHPLPPPLVQLNSNSGNKFNSNPFSWFSKQLPKNPLESLSLMTSSSSHGSTYASFADPPLDSIQLTSNKQQPKRRRKIFDQITKLFNSQQSLPPALEQLIKDQQQSTSESKRITSFLRSPLQSSTAKTELNIMKHLIEAYEKNGTSNINSKSDNIVATSPSYLPLTLPKPTYTPQVASTHASIFTDSSSTTSIDKNSHTISRKHDDLPENETEWLHSHDHSIERFFNSVPNIHSLDQVSTDTPVSSSSSFSSSFKGSQLITNDSFVPMMKKGSTFSRTKRQALFPLDIHNRPNNHPQLPFGTPVHSAGTFPLVFPATASSTSSLQHHHHLLSPELNNLFNSPAASELFRSPFKPIKLTGGQETKIHNPLSRFFPTRSHPHPSSSHAHHHLQGMGDSISSVMVPFFSPNGNSRPTGGKPSSHSMNKYSFASSNVPSSIANAPPPLVHLPNPFPTVPLDTFDYESIKSAVDSVPFSTLLSNSNTGLPFASPGASNIATGSRGSPLRGNNHSVSHKNSSPNVASSKTTKVISPATSSNIFASNPSSSTHNLLSTPFPPLKYDAKTGTFYEPLFGSHIPASLTLNDFSPSLLHSNFIRDMTNSPSPVSTNNIRGTSNSGSNSKSNNNNVITSNKFKFVPLREAPASITAGSTQHHSTQSIHSTRPSSSSSSSTGDNMYHFPKPVPLPLKSNSHSHTHSPVSLKNTQASLNTFVTSHSPSKASMISYEYMFKPTHSDNDASNFKLIHSINRRPPLRDRVPVSAVTQVSYEKVNFPLMKETTYDVKDYPHSSDNRQHSLPQASSVKPSPVNVSHLNVIDRPSVVKNTNPSLNYVVNNKKDKKPQASNSMASKVASSPLLNPVATFAPDGSARIFHANYKNSVKNHFDSFPVFNQVDHQGSFNHFHSPPPPPPPPSSKHPLRFSTPTDSPSGESPVTPLQKEIEALIADNKINNHTQFYNQPMTNQFDDQNNDHQSSNFDKIASHTSHVELPAINHDISWPRPHQFTKPIHSPQDVPSLHDRPDHVNSQISEHVRHTSLFPENLDHFAKTPVQVPKIKINPTTQVTTDAPAYGQKISVRVPHVSFGDVFHSKTTSRPNVIHTSPPSKNQVWWNDKNIPLRPPYLQHHSVSDVNIQPTSDPYITSTSDPSWVMKNDYSNENRSPQQPPLKEWTELDKHSPTPVYRPEDDEEKNQQPPQDYFESDGQRNSPVNTFTGSQHSSYNYMSHHNADQNEMNAPHPPPLIHDDDRLYHQQNTPVFTEPPPPPPPLISTRAPPPPPPSSSTTTTPRPVIAYEEPPVHTNHKPVYDQNVEYYDNDIKSNSNNNVNFDFDSNHQVTDVETENSVSPVITEETTTIQPRRPSLFNKRPGHQLFVDRYKKQPHSSHPSSSAMSKNNILTSTISSNTFIQTSSTSAPNVQSTGDDDTTSYGSRLNSPRTPIISVKASVSTSIKPSVTYPYQAKTSPAPTYKPSPKIPSVFGRFTSSSSSTNGRATTPVTTQTTSTSTTTTTTSTTTELPMEYSDEDLDQVFKHTTHTTARPSSSTTSKYNSKLSKLRTRYNGWTSTTQPPTTSTVASSTASSSSSSPSGGSDNLFTGRLSSIRDMGILEIDDPNEEESIITDAIDEHNENDFSESSSSIARSSPLIATTTAIPNLLSTTSIDVTTSPPFGRKIFTSSSGGSLNTRVNLQRVKFNTSPSTVKFNSSQG